MITTWFYATSTLADPLSCTNKNRGNTACKHAEFINVWYDYVRYVYGPKEHIYIIDNGSPIPFKNAWLGQEDVEYLDVDQYSYNPNIFVHVKRFDEQLNHGAGVVRGTLEMWKMADKNNLDLLFCEADSLSLINLYKELEGNDLVTVNIEHGERGCIDCCNMAIRQGLLRSTITKVPEAYGYNKLSILDSLEQSVATNGYCSTQPNYQYYESVENGPYINFRDKKLKKIEDNRWIHDVGFSKLFSFLNEAARQGVQSNRSFDYISKLHNSHHENR